MSPCPLPRGRYYLASDLLAWINEEIVKLGTEQFFHYAETLAPVYGKTSNPDDLVVEGGKL